MYLGNKINDSKLYISSLLFNFQKLLILQKSYLNHEINALNANDALI